MDLFVVVFFFGCGGASNLDFIAVLFFATASALSLKTRCLTHAIYSGEKESERGNMIVVGGKE